VRLKAIALTLLITLITFISIPSGAIKRAVCGHTPPPCNKFQFLLVRLKEKRTNRSYLRQGISIPSGAIKSKTSFLLLPVLFKFQFLLVRLKENNEGLSWEDVVEFQFLLVRLKGYFCHFKGNYKHDFNSFWCD